MDGREIKGRKVILKPLTRSVFEGVASWPKHTGLYVCYNRDEFETQESRDKWYNRIVEADEVSYWFSIHKLSGDFIGFLSIHRLDGDPWQRETEIGIEIRPDECNKGYGQDAITTLVKNIFEETGFTHLGIGARRWNKRALRCYEKCGFSQCGESIMTLNGEVVDFIEMELKKENLQTFFQKT